MRYLNVVTEFKKIMTLYHKEIVGKKRSILIIKVIKNKIKITIINKQSLKKISINLDDEIKKNNKIMNLIIKLKFYKITNNKN